MDYKYEFPEVNFFIDNFCRNLEKHPDYFKGKDIEEVKKIIIDFEDVGNAYYYDHRNHGWNKNGLRINIAAKESIISKFERLQPLIRRAAEKSIIGSSGYDLVDINYLVISKKDEEFQKIDSNIQDKIKMISVRNADFEEMTLDEKLGMLNMLIENLLKKDGEYIQLPYDKIFYDYISEQDIKHYRKKTHSERHGTEEALEERLNISDKEKNFLIDFGIFIVIHLFRYIEEVNYDL